MKWYGKNFYNDSYKQKKYLINQKIRLVKKFKLYAVPLSFRINLNNYRLIFSLPYFWNFLFIKKNNNRFLLYFYSNTYYFFLPLSVKFLMFFFDPYARSFSLNFFYINNFYKIFWNIFKLVFFSFTKVFFRKLKFKGKGYYIYKNKRNTIALRFGYSHIKRLFFFFSYVKFLSKTSVFIFGIDKFTITSLSIQLKNVRPINIFTGKGVRFTRQIIYRKTGKISSYR